MQTSESGMFSRTHFDGVALLDRVVLINDLLLFFLLLKTALGQPFRTALVTGG